MICRRRSGRLRVAIVSVSAAIIPVLACSTLEAALCLLGGEKSRHRGAGMTARVAVGVLWFERAYFLRREDRLPAGGPSIWQWRR